ncbi:MAG TPA: hypothetical protein VJP76_05745 [Candidatus Tumulicola sp.]|nr:hypothetical protein [Candidatus Tumulicola sp.]
MIFRDRARLTTLGLLDRQRLPQSFFLSTPLKRPRVERLLGGVVRGVDGGVDPLVRRLPFLGYDRVERRPGLQIVEIEIARILGMFACRVDR